MADSDNRFQLLAGKRILVIAFDFLVGLSVSVYLKQMGASTEGPLLYSDAVAGYLTRFILPDIVVLQTEPHGFVPSHISDAIRANRLPFVTSTDPTHWDGYLLAEILEALNRPASQTN